MTIPKKGSRKVVVDSVVYRWTIRNKPIYSQGAFGSDMTAAVELAESSGAVLSITFPWLRCDSWIGYPELPITPKDIEKCIISALQNGWQPEKKGRAFKYVHESKA
ncbi:hypothetical protein A7985_07330 [Pseudoalteromonas luteoviolacea]|uniref:Uncharacterized protein n=1 Tax=Pseudoalteromonas luteoviolacea TaxID=43657 RepID=A0A1C0TWQ1_9GAMM|nr:hypothetical protein [Pseudoalteromonas luteoviolacea]MBQ4810269.1 hypothetical protein [Pseudoalteromonas luteoviolacea]OCQ23743.1 hypothetical protein A7985_07330 [Pseudoalteromonas luteoviolacea]